MALCSLSPSTNHHLISHLWTCVHGCQPTHAYLLLHPQTAFGWHTKGTHPNETDLTHTHTRSLICPSDKSGSSDMVQHARGSQLDHLLIGETRLCDHANHNPTQKHQQPAKHTHIQFHPANHLQNINSTFDPPHRGTLSQLSRRTCRQYLATKT